MSARNPEMSRAQFRKALERNQFRQVLLLWVQDTSGTTTFSWGMIMHASGKPAYRATLGRALRERRKIEEFTVGKGPCQRAAEAAGWRYIDGDMFFTVGKGPCQRAAEAAGWRYIDGDMFGRGEERASARDWKGLCEANEIEVGS